jgi:SulP family sulfate permease
MNKVLRKDLPGHRPAFLSRVLGELKSIKLVPSLAAGAVIGLLNIFVAVSFAALIFSGDLSGYVADGIGLLLIGAAVAGILVALFSTIPGSVVGNQSISAAIMVVMIAGMIKRIPSLEQPGALMPTIVMTMGLTGLLFGLFCFLLACFDFGNLVRFLPYSVVGGFLAGMGWLLVTGAIGLMANTPVALSGLGALLQTPAITRWLPGLFFALTLLFLLRRIDSFLVLPSMIVGAIGLFHLAAWLGGFSVEQLADHGWLLQAIQADNLWQPLPWANFEHVNWAAIGGQLPSMGTLIVLSVVSLLFNASGLEVSTRQDVSLNRELRANGLANLGIAVFGGMSGHLHLSFSIINIKIGGINRWSGIVAAATCILAVAIGPSLVILVPKLLMGGLLLYLGFSFLKTWVYDTWFRLSRLEYVTVVIILIVIGSVGLLEGVALGMIASVIFFTFTYSRIDVIRHELTGQHLKSRLTRSPYLSQRLHEEGHRIHILSLQGYLFFGTAERLVGTVRQRLRPRNGPVPEFILMDFCRVNGLDSTVTSHLHKLKQLARTRPCTMIITGEPSICYQLQKGGLSPDDKVRYFDDLDRALEWYEDELLGRLGLSDDATPVGLFRQWDSLGLAISKLEILPRFLQRLEVKPGDYLMVEGDEPDCLYFVESGQVTAQLEYPDRLPLRLESLGSGRVVGEIGFYLGQARTASVIVDKPGVVYRLTEAALGEIEREEPQIASALHRLMASLLAQRATHLIQVVDALER